MAVLEIYGEPNPEENQGRIRVNASEGRKRRVVTRYWQRFRQNLPLTSLFRCFKRRHRWLESSQEYSASLRSLQWRRGLLPKYEFYGRFYLDGQWLPRERVILAFCSFTSLNRQATAYGWLKWTLFERVQTASEVAVNIWPLVPGNVAWSLPTLQGQRNPWLAVDQQVVSVLFSLQFPARPLSENLGQYFSARYQIPVPNVTRSPDVDWRQNVPTWPIRN